MKETIVGAVDFDSDQRVRGRSGVEIMGRAFRGWWRGIFLQRFSKRPWATGLVAQSLATGEIEGRARYASLRSRERYALRLLLDDIHPAKPKSFCNRGTDAPSAVQNRIEFGAINVIALREGGLTSLAFNCGLQQINDV